MKGCQRVTGNWLILIVFFGVLGLQPSLVTANRHALLIGVGQNDLGSGSLDGPVWDVKALHRILSERWDIPESSITELCNENATRKSILRTLAQLEQDTKTGDSILIYFSGHGSSAEEKTGYGAHLPSDTGCILPYDLKGVPNNPLAKVIIGRRDLRPLLDRLDKGRHVLVIFDACFSGDTIRSIQAYPRLGAANRFFSLPSESRFSAKDSFSQVLDFTTESIKREPYPYRNILFMSASSRFEPALDINSSMNRLFQTFDGQSHGAFTDSLLHALNGEADMNRDGLLTIREIFHWTKSRVSSYWGHTPQLLIPVNKEYLQDEPFLNVTNPFINDLQSPSVIGTKATEKKLRVKLDQTIGRETCKAIEDLPNVIISSDRFDLLATSQSQKWILALVNGDIVAEIPGMDQTMLVSRLDQFSTAWKLINFKPTNPKSTVFLEIPGYGGALIEGDEIGFRIRPDIDSYLLLLNIDSSGNVSILYPSSDQERYVVRGKDTVVIPSCIKICNMFGIEYFKIVAFEQKPPGYDDLKTEQFSSLDLRFRKVMEMLENAGVVCESTLQCISFPKTR